jgi:hypothetical protein
MNGSTMNGSATSAAPDTMDSSVAPALASLYDYADLDAPAELVSRPAVTDRVSEVPSNPSVAAQLSGEGGDFDLTTVTVSDVTPAKDTVLAGLLSRDTALGSALAVAATGYLLMALSLALPTSASAAGVGAALAFGAFAVAVALR